MSGIWIRHGRDGFFCSTVSGALLERRVSWGWYYLVVSFLVSLVVDADFQQGLLHVAWASAHVVAGFQE